ncbi:unnamed protein product [Rhodiola kirilowii]
MKDSETIPEFNARVLVLSNEVAALGKPIDGERMASKVLRSLHPRFAMKVTTIEEMHDISTLKLDELMGSLRTYEMNHEVQPREGKGITLKAEVSKDMLESGCTTEQLAMMAQNFGRMIQKINRRGPEQGQSSSSNFRNWKKGKTRTSENRQDSSEKGKEIQCRECRGFGHIQAECANTLQKKKAMVANLSDNESDDEEEGDETTNFVAFVATTGECSKSSKSMPPQFKHSADDSSDSDDEELTRETSENLQELYEKWLLVINLNKKLTDTIASTSIEKDKMWQEVEILVTQKVELQGKVDLLNTQLTEMKQERSSLLAQKTELLATVSSLKVEMEKDRDTHPVGMAGLKKK